MNGLMVSLIIVIFAGMTNTVMAAGQQAQQDAAKFEPRRGLQPLAAPRFDRPGPDDSDDDAWPTPTSLLSRESTNTSSFGDRQLRASAPESVSGQNVRFDVKVDENAIDLLRQGRKVFSPVDVRDQDTNALLHRGVVSDIALFLGANAGKNLQGVQLEPQPMEFGSKTLKFEIREDQLEQIAQDAFLFSVPDELRGKFDRVEFELAARPTGSHEFSTGLSSGRRGSAFGFGGENGANGFGANPARRANEATPWNTAQTPRPGPGFEPGQPEFTGPYISPAELQARNRVAPLDPNRQPSEFARSPLDTGGQFQTTRREREIEPKQSLADRPWLQAQGNQIPRRQATTQQNQFAQVGSQQGSQESAAAQELRLAKQQLAQAKAEQELLLRDASDWKREAQTLAQERNSLGQQLQEVSERVVTKQPVSAASMQYTTSRDYLGRAIDAPGNLVSPWGSQREDFARRETAFAGRAQVGRAQVGRTQAELDQQEFIDMKSRIEFQRKENLQLKSEKLNVEEDLVAAREMLLKRRPTYDSGIQPTSYNGQSRDGFPRVADADLAYGQGNAGADKLAQDIARQQQAGSDARRNRGGEERANTGAAGAQELGANKKSSSDLIWLLPLLLLSLGLNFFLWIHARSLYLRYDELAEDLRGMVGGSTI